MPRRFCSKRCRACTARADDDTELIDDVTFSAEADEALESAVQALGFYTCAVKEARQSLAPAEPLPQLIEKLAAAQARVNALVTKAIEEARARLRLRQRRLWRRRRTLRARRHVGACPPKALLSRPVQQPLPCAHCAVRPLRHQGQGVHLGSVQWGPARRLYIAHRPS